MKRAGHPLGSRMESRGARDHGQYWNPYSQVDHPYGPHIAYPNQPVLSSEEIARQNEFIEKMQGSPTISLNFCLCNSYEAVAALEQRSPGHAHSYNL
jgi:hypothetical protein